MRNLTHRPLSDGPLDIVGDIHGEWEALSALLHLLGYSEDGHHPQGRQLVFLGDLCDRGPDSPRVIHRVRDLVLAQRAWCLLGNHELNLLRGSAKSGNGWFFAIDHDHARGRHLDDRRATSEERELFLAFFGALPLTLERADLRLVHACWNAEAQDRMRNITVPVHAAYLQEEERVQQMLRQHPDHAAAVAEGVRYQAMAEDPDTLPPAAAHFARQEERYQNGNAVRVLSSGMEQVTDTPFFSTGKWRLHERVRWWDTYTDDVPVLFGHYWRMRDGAHFPAHKGAANPFAGVGQEAWLGPRRNSFCLDFSVGYRSYERAAGISHDFAGQLAAMRWPERELVMTRQ